MVTRYRERIIDVLLTVWIAGVTLIYVFYGLSYLRAVQALTSRLTAFYEWMVGLL
jgi:hypothetical protein